MVFVDKSIVRFRLYRNPYSRFEQDILDKNSQCGAGVIDGNPLFELNYRDAAQK